IGALHTITTEEQVALLRWPVTTGAQSGQCRLGHRPRVGVALATEKAMLEAESERLPVALGVRVEVVGQLGGARLQKLRRDPDLGPANRRRERAEQKLQRNAGESEEKERRTSAQPHGPHVGSQVQPWGQRTTVRKCSPLRPPSPYALDRCGYGGEALGEF